MYSYDSKYTKNFYDDLLTELKRNQLTEFAVSLLEVRKLVSEEVNSNLIKYMNMKKFDFVTYMRKKYEYLNLSSYFDVQLFTDVYVAYLNKFEALTKKLRFEKRTFNGFEFYKRNSKKHKKGELKKVVHLKEQTPLSMTLTYLARYGNQNSISYIQIVYNSVSEEQLKYYDNILYCVDKFGFDRLLNLALRKKERVLSKYKNPINFKSLTFSGKTSCIQNIVKFNKNRRSKISGFITINVPFRKGLSIPVKLNSNYHDKPITYCKNLNKKDQYSYRVRIDENKKVIILLCKDGLRSLPLDKTNYIGCDVNIKNNLLALSDGTIYDYDRKLLNEYLKVLNQIDNLKKENKGYQPGKRKQKVIKSFQRLIKSSILKTVVHCCKDLVDKGFDHLVLENLDNSFKSSYIKNDEFDEKYNRLNHLLGIGSIKDQFKQIGSKYGVSVSFVQPEYTSQMCPICGYIDSENRPTQEEFNCVNCGYTANADLNAANNIKNRVEQTVFASSLLNKNPDGSYSPKKLKHEKVCEKIQQSICKINKNVLKVI